MGSSSTYRIAAGLNGEASATPASPRKPQGWTHAGGRIQRSCRIDQAENAKVFAPSPCETGSSARPPSAIRRSWTGACHGGPKSLMHLRLEQINRVPGGGAESKLGEERRSARHADAPRSARPQEALLQLGSLTAKNSIGSWSANISSSMEKAGAGLSVLKRFPRHRLCSLTGDVPTKPEVPESPQNLAGARL